MELEKEKEQKEEQMRALEQRMASAADATAQDERNACVAELAVICRALSRLEPSPVVARRPRQATQAPMVAPLSDEIVVDANADDEPVDAAGVNAENATVVYHGLAAPARAATPIEPRAATPIEPRAATPIEPGAAVIDNESEPRGQPLTEMLQGIVDEPVPTYAQPASQAADAMDVDEPPPEPAPKTPGGPESLFAKSELWAEAMLPSPGMQIVFVDVHQPGAAATCGGLFSRTASVGVLSAPDEPHRSSTPPPPGIDPNEYTGGGSGDCENASDLHIPPDRILVPASPSSPKLLSAAVRRRRLKPWRPLAHVRDVTPKGILGKVLSIGLAAAHDGDDNGSSCSFASDSSGTSVFLAAPPPSPSRPSHPVPPTQ